MRSACLAIVFSLQLFTLCRAGELWIAPQGSDLADGSRTAPMATVQAALARDPRVHLRVAPGTYRLPRAIELGPANAGVTIEAADATRPPVFEAARTVGGFVPQARGIWKAQADFRVQHLWVNGRRAIPARTPNTGWLYATGAVGWGPDPLGGALVQRNRSVLQVRSTDAAAIHALSVDDLRDVRVVAWHAWSVSQHALRAVQRAPGAEPAGDLLVLGSASLWPFFQFGDVQRYQLQNYLQAVDAPGEWFQARDGAVYYLPRMGEDMRSAVVVAPVAAQFLRIDGAHDVTVRGLRLHYSGGPFPASGVAGVQAAAEAGASITVDNARSVKLLDLEIAHTADYAVWFRAGSSEGLLAHSELHDLGAGGVRIGETSTVPTVPERGSSGTVVRDCIIRDGGHVFPDGVGVLVGHSGRNLIRNNDISGLFYSGISMGWVWGYASSLAVGNRVEGNHIHHLGFGMLSDMGGIYTLGVSPDTVVRGNRVHDINSYDRYGRGAWGLYADEGSSDILFEDNLVYRTGSAGFHQHYGRNNTVRNNIFALGREGQLERTRVEAHASFRFEGNIVASAGAPLLLGQWQDGNFQIDRNHYSDMSGAALSWAGRSLAQWQGSGRDLHSVVAAPPFIDPGRDDFRLRAVGAVASIGFKPLPEAGVSGDAEWKARAAASVYPPLAAPQEPVPAQPLRLREGFEQQPPGTAPDFARVVVEGKGDSIAVSAERAHGGRQSLRLRDAPGLAQVYDPFLFYRPRHVQGHSRLRFSVYLEPGAKFWHEWRDAASPYLVGPSLTMVDGRLRAGGRDLGDLPPSTWITVEVRAALASAMACTWTLVVTPDRAPARQTDLPCRDAGWKSLSWLGFVSNDTQSSTIYLDDLELDNTP